MSVHMMSSSQHETYAHKQPPGYDIVYILLSVMLFPVKELFAGAWPGSYFFDVFVFCDTCVDYCNTKRV